MLAPFTEPFPDRDRAVLPAARQIDAIVEKGNTAHGRSSSPKEDPHRLLVTIHVGTNMGNSSPRSEPNAGTRRGV